MNEFDQALSEADQCIFDTFGDDAVLIKADSTEVPVKIILDETLEQYEDQHVDHARSVLIGTLATPDITHDSVEILKVTTGKHMGEYKLGQIIQKDFDTTAFLLE